MYTCYYSKLYLAIKNHKQKAPHLVYIIATPCRVMLNAMCPLLTLPANKTFVESAHAYCIPNAVIEQFSSTLKLPPQKYFNV